MSSMSSRTPYANAILTRALREVATAVQAGRTLRARELGAALNMSESRGLEVRRALIKEGLIKELRPATGNRAAVIDVTEAGWARLGGRPAEAAMPTSEGCPCKLCGKPFASEGPHNRFCDPCREGVAFRDGPDLGYRVALP